MDKAYKVAKIIALCIPSFIGLALLVVVLLKFTGTMTDFQILEAKMDSLIGIIGVAVSVWIGLNVYNLIEKNQVEKVSELYNLLKEDILEQDKKTLNIELYNNWHDTCLVLLVDINIAAIYDKNDTEQIVENTKILISEYKLVNESNLKLKVQRKMPYNKQYTLLLEAFRVIVQYKKTDWISVEVGKEFAIAVLNAMLYTLAVDNEKLCEEVTHIKDFVRKSYADTQSVLEYIQIRVNEIGWSSPQITGKFSEIIERIQKIQ